METAIAFAAGMLLTLVALALEDWTRLSKWRKATPLPDEELGAARMLFSSRQRNSVSGREHGNSRPERTSGTRRVA
jgi:hypothetical protein